MNVTTHDVVPGQGARIDAIIVGGGGYGTASTAVEAVGLAGGRVIAQVEWDEAVERISLVGARPVILLEAQDVAEDRLAETLPRLDGLAAGRDLSVIAGIAESQIDTTAAGLLVSGHEILCAPRPFDWVGALASLQLVDQLVLHDRVGESESVRLAHLNAEVARITNVLASLSTHDDRAKPNVADRTLGFAAESDGRPAVAPAEIRHIVRARRMRDRHFGEGMFEDPAWDMMLDLYAAHLERAQVSVSSLCIAAAMAPTTALRWIARLTEAGLFEHRPDPFDRRRAFMSLSESGLDAMHRYVATVRALDLPLV
ncbi:MarR family winged helix-turn-helix transcriptional regulator [Sphingomonas radiodurans]|uniref:MarR family winged helix-turn-helix transcriptional regulator n=1 Tax=Sphingomonas radiodurans TaxID=2890321 RepID=UPI001E45A9C9|nr:MarR family winged helix-turn-helix transcriptional regulator [Sphingomonas radiodurans]WBH16126.1 MarR family winged helix-turn-helix transcriptional regulator [Sphingomonas radiodurans]